MNSFEILDMMMKSAISALTLVNDRLLNLTVEDPEFDVAIQLQKDYKRFIAEQEHTKSLVDNGMI